MIIAHFTEQSIINPLGSNRLNFFFTVGKCKLQYQQQERVWARKTLSSEGSSTGENGKKKHHLVKHSAGIFLGYHSLNTLKAKSDKKERYAF